jgi:CDP-diacylglycerol--glycerol-3-phosphate 3-phosphatidyltransferase
MNLPNTLTVIRILMVPILVVVLMTRVPNHEIIGSIVFWVACITDFYDGYLARKLGQVTVLGKLLDPLADKLLIAGALMSLIELGLTPAWMAFIILGREMAITGMRGLASEEGLTIAADRLGKWKLGAQIAAISCLLFGPVYDEWFFLITGLRMFNSLGIGEFFATKWKPR